MPALTYSQVETSLGTYKEPGADFRAALNQVIPRLYSSGIYRDLTIQYQLPIADGCITLPKDADSVLMFQLNGYAAPVRSLWHDFKAAGMNGTVDPSLWGLVDAGYHATSRLLTESVKTLFAVPSVMSTDKSALDFGDITLSIVGTDGEEMFLAEDVICATVSGTLVPNFNGVYAPVAVQDGQWLYTLNGVAFTGEALYSGSSMFYSSDVGGWVIAMVGTPGVIDILGWWFSSPTVDEPPWGSMTWTAGVSQYAPATGVVDVDSGPRAYVFSTPVSSIVSIKFSQETGTSIVDIRTDPDDPETTIATVGPESTVTRYRRYRIPSSTADTTAHVLVKRAFEPLVNDDDLIYISNLAAIKHGLLGLVAEDNADLERAQYHWAEAQKNMEMEMESARGGAIPSISFDIMGMGGRSVIHTML
jgi:hypothetical protein